MKVTFILKNLSEQFYSGNGGSIPGLVNMTNREKYNYLSRKCHDLHVTKQIGSGAFRDGVDLNMMLRKPCAFSFKLEVRKGYKLATFHITEVKE